MKMLGILSLNCNHKSASESAATVSVNLFVTVLFVFGGNNAK